MRIDPSCCFSWDHYTRCSIRLFRLQMSLLFLLDWASSQFRLKHELSIFEGPKIRLDHLRFETDLSDLLVCLVEESVGGTSQVRVRCSNYWGKRFTPLIMHLVRMSCQYDDLRRQRGHPHFDWYEFFYWIRLFGISARASSELRRKGVNKADNI